MLFTTKSWKTPSRISILIKMYLGLLLLAHLGLAHLHLWLLLVLSVYVRLESCENGRLESDLLYVSETFEQ